MDEGINYLAIAEAVRFYRDEHDFEYVNLPWVVSSKACDLTRPSEDAGRVRISHIKGEAVASGEQSFLALVLAGKLKPGKYVGVSPCFRVEDETSEWKLPYFMKVELFVLGGRDIMETLGPARAFFEEYLEAIDVVPVSAYQSDIYYDGIELGSYNSYKKAPIGHWVCGTGCAEPRFSLSCKKIQKIREDEGL